jgi:uncharacterized protein YukE
MSLEVQVGDCGDLGDLVASGLAVTAHGEDLAARHFAADGLIDASVAGWRGQSAVALGVLADQWAATTAGLLVRLREDASALHTSALAFAEHEQRAAAVLAAP